MSSYPYGIGRIIIIQSLDIIVRYCMILFRVICIVIGCGQVRHQAVTFPCLSITVCLVFYNFADYRPDTGMSVSDYCIRKCRCADCSSPAHRSKCWTHRALVVLIIIQTERLLNPRTAFFLQTIKLISPVFGFMFNPNMVTQIFPLLSSHTVLT